MNESKTIEKTTPSQRVYYALYRKYGFTIPARDDNGDFVPKRDAQGNPLFRKGQKVYQEQSKQFVTLIDSPSRGYVSTFVVRGEENRKGEFNPNNKDEFDACERMANDGSLKVLTQEKYEASVNPTAAALKQELVKKDKEIESVKAEAEERESSLQLRLAEMDAQIAELTKPSAKAGK